MMVQKENFISILQIFTENYNTLFLNLLLSPTNRNSAKIADINNRNQVSCVLIFTDTVNLSKLCEAPEKL
jgi:hypothetical protein